jgi:hypothetical protein
MEPIVQALTLRYPEAVFRIDDTPHEEANSAGTSRRPDITATLPASAFVLDMKCPFPTRARDNKSFVERVDDANLDKYRSIADEYARSYSKVVFGTVIVPSVGPVPALTFKVLRSCGLTAPAISKALRYASIAVARQNYRLIAPTLSSPKPT